jgi:pimeloyl-ACP methyl ester carboxylesterase
MRRRWVVLPIVLLLVALAAYGAVSWVFSDRLVAQQFTALGPVDFSEYALPAPETVTIRGEGVGLVAWYFDNPREAGCATVMLHGFGGSRAEILAATPIFWQRGCDLLLYDARGHGDSDRALLSFGANEREDLLRAVEWLSARTVLPRSKVGLIGWSYGAATAIQGASEAGGDVAFVIADSSFSSLGDIARVQAEEQYGSWAKIFVPGALFVSSVRGGFDARDPAPVAVIEDVRSPVLLVHSRQDGFTPVEHSERIYAESDKSRTRLVIPEWEAAHALSFKQNPVAYTALVDGFLNAFAPGFGGRLAR